MCYANGIFLEREGVTTTTFDRRTTWTDLKRQLTDEEHTLLALIRRHPGYRVGDLVQDLKRAGFNGSFRQTQQRLRYLTHRGLLKRERAASYATLSRPPYGYRLTALGERFAPL